MEEDRLMSLNPESYEQAKLAFKPLKRSRMTRKASSALKTSPASNLRRQSLSRKSVKKSKRKKKLTTGQWKKKAWREFSVWVRANDATRDLGLERCVTCGTVKHWKELHAGHFIRGRLNANLFDERGCHPQCYGCNVGKQGEVVVYYKWMLARYGQEVIDDLLAQNNKTHKWLPGELQGIYEKYKALNDLNPLLKDSE
jgi:hypothetical protein